jgi:hypothetical protein
VGGGHRWRHHPAADLPVGDRKKEHRPPLTERQRVPSPRQGPWSIDSL